MSKKKDKVYNVKVVEDQTKPTFTFKMVLIVLVLIIGIYLIFNSVFLFEAIISEEIDFIQVLRETSKDLVYSTNFTFVVFIVNSIAFNKKRK